MSFQARVSLLLSLKNWKYTKSKTNLSFPSILHVVINSFSFIYFLYK